MVAVGEELSLLNVALAQLEGFHFPKFFYTASKLVSTATQ
jgi:hypothetical protein